MATDRLAWRSFWLGIASIVLLFLTGIPAIYYGTKSLLRMRFFKPKRSDRIAAIAGTAMGGCFGVCLGLFVITAVIVGVVIAFTAVRTQEPAEVMAMCSEVFEIDVPSGVEPFRATSVLNSMQFFDFCDRPNRTERRIRIHLSHQDQALKVSKTQFIKNLDGRSLNRDRHRTEDSHVILHWEMNGDPVEVKKTIYRLEGEGSELSEVFHYIGYFAEKGGMYGMVVTLIPAEFELSEEQIQELFASVRLRVESNRTSGGVEPASVE